MLISTAKYAPIDAEPLLQTHEQVKRALVVVVASDRGLAGGFNSNVLRHAEKLIKEKERQGVEVEVAACGKKAIGYFNYRGIKPVFEFAGLSADPTYEQAAELSLYAGDSYRYGKLDEVFVVYNHAKNAAEQTLVEQQILPINQQSYADLLGLNPKEEDVLEKYREDEKPLQGDIDFEPDAESVMFYLMKAYLRNTFFYALLDSAAGEQGARRNAMKSATDNANEMVSTLTRVYNRVRQVLSPPRSPRSLAVPQLWRNKWLKLLRRRSARAPRDVLSVSSALLWMSSFRRPDAGHLQRPDR